MSSSINHTIMTGPSSNTSSSSLVTRHNLPSPSSNNTPSLGSPSNNGASTIPPSPSSSGVINRTSSTSSSTTPTSATPASKTQTTNLRVPFLAAVFALSGAAINMLQQQLYYMGAGDAGSLILIVPTFLGMIVGGLVSQKTQIELQFIHQVGGTSSAAGGAAAATNVAYSDGWKQQLPIRMKQMIFVSIFDVTSLSLRSTSQNYCGSGMFTVIYAILPAFNGALSYVFMNRVLNRWQWMSILTVIIGLAFATQAEEDDLKSESKRNEVFFGILLGLAGTLSSSSSYLCAERVFKGPRAPTEGTTVTAINGINDTIIALPWLLFYSFPNRRELIYEPVSQHGSNPLAVLLVWVLLCASNAAHLNSCYVLLQITESVTLTMLQGLRAVLVFAFSGLLYCNATHPEQCLSIQKVCCSMVVVAGVFMYARNTPGLSTDKRKHKHSILPIGSDQKEKSSFLEDQDTAESNI